MIFSLLRENPDREKGEKENYKQRYTLLAVAIFPRGKNLKIKGLQSNSLLHSFQKNKYILTHSLPYRYCSHQHPRN